MNPSPPKNPRTETFVQRYGHLCPTGCTQKRILLANHFTSQISQLNRHNFARIWRSKSHAALAHSIVGEMRHEQRLACQNAFTSPQQ